MALAIISSGGDRDFFYCPVLQEQDIVPMKNKVGYASKRQYFKSQKFYEAMARAQAAEDW